MQKIQIGQYNNSLELISSIDELFNSKSKRLYEIICEKEDNKLKDLYFTYSSEESDSLKQGISNFFAEKVENLNFDECEVKFNFKNQILQIIELKLKDNDEMQEIKFSTMQQYAKDRQCLKINKDLQIQMAFISKQYNNDNQLTYLEFNFGTDPKQVEQLAQQQEDESAQEIKKEKINNNQNQKLQNEVKVIDKYSNQINNFNKNDLSLDQNNKKSKNEKALITNNIRDYQEQFSKLQEFNKSLPCEIKSEPHKELIKVLRDEFQEIYNIRVDIEAYSQEIQIKFNELPDLFDLLKDKTIQAIRYCAVPDIKDLDQLQTDFKTWEKDCQQILRELEKLQKKLTALQKRKELGQQFDKVESQMIHNDIVQKYNENLDQDTSNKNKLNQIQCEIKELQLFIDINSLIIEDLIPEIDQLSQDKKYLEKENSNLQIKINNVKEDRKDINKLKKEFEQQRIKQKQRNEEQTILQEKNQIKLEEEKHRLSQMLSQFGIQNNYHFIFVLDCSASMTNDWDKLEKIYRNFIEEKKSNDEDCISLVTFQSIATVEIENNLIRTVESDHEIKMKFGGTNFYNAFVAAQNCVQLTTIGYCPIVLFFTDGKDESGQDYLQIIKQMKKDNNDMIIFCMGYGDIGQGTQSLEILKKIQQAGNNTNKDFIEINGKKINPVKTTSNMKEIEIFIDEISKFSVNQKEQIKSAIEDLQELKEINQENLYSQVKKQEELENQYLINLKKIIENDEIHSQESLNKQKQFLNDSLQLNKNLITKIDEQIKQKQEKLKKSEIEIKYKQKQCQDKESEEEQQIKLIKDFQKQNLEENKQLDQQMKSIIENWGFKSKKIYDLFIQQLERGEILSKTSKHLQQYIFQIQSDFGSLKLKCKNIFVKIKDIDKRQRQTEKGLIYYETMKEIQKDIPQISTSINDKSQNFKTLFDYYFKNDKKKEDLDQYFEQLSNIDLIEFISTNKNEIQDFIENAQDQVIEGTDDQEILDLKDTIKEIQSEKKIKDIEKDHLKNLNKAEKDANKKLDKLSGKIKIFAYKILSKIYNNVRDIFELKQKLAYGQQLFNLENQIDQLCYLSGQNQNIQNALTW